MSLIVPQPPAESLEIVRAALERQVGQKSIAGEVLSATGAGNLAVALPHQVYFIGLEDIAEGNLLAAARLGRWRYIMLKDDNPTAAAEISINRDSKALKFSNINRGVFIEGTIEAIRSAERLDEVQASDYELRLLNIPAMHVVAIWLHGEQDILIPVQGSHSSLNPNAPYTEHEFLKALQGPATDMLQTVGNEKGG
jgi:hypothetical protein